MERLILRRPDLSFRLFLTMGHIMTEVRLSGIPGPDQDNVLRYPAIRCCADSLVEVRLEERRGVLFHGSFLNRV